MNLNEKNHVLADALDDIKHFLAERCGGHPDNIEAQYDCNKAAFDHIAKILANVMRLDLFGDGLPKGTAFTPEAINKFMKEELKADVPPAEQPIDPRAPTLNAILANPPFDCKLKMLGISMPGHAVIKYKVDDPELPRLAASIETIKSDSGKVSCDCTLYAGNEVLADMQVYRGKSFALEMTRRALKGAMSRFGKRRRMSANRQSREAAKKEAV